MSMQVFSILARKGGVGKSTLAVHLAIEAGHAALIDMDEQESLLQWAERRTTEEPPVLKADHTALKGALAACRTNGYRHVFIDTMPQLQAMGAIAANLADLCIIPTGPQAFDMESIAETVEMVKTAKAKATIVLNLGRPGSGINEQALAFLSKQYGLPVCPTVVMRRAVLGDSLFSGQAVQEQEPKGKAAAEIKNLWRWIRKELP